MQLQFTREELKLLAEILEETAATSTAALKAKSSALLTRVIEHDLRLAFDELEDLEDILLAHKKVLSQKLAQAGLANKPTLAQRAALSERIKDKVTEACAMV